MSNQQLSVTVTLAGLMTADQLEAWRTHMGLSVAAAAKALGGARPSWYAGVQGRVLVPKAVELACAALVLGVKSYPPSSGSPHPVTADGTFVLASPFVSEPSGPGAPGAPGFA